MCKKMKCAEQYTVDLINNNISRNMQESVQTGCTEYIYIAAIRMMRIVNILQFIKLSHVDVMRLSLSLGA